MALLSYPTTGVGLAGATDGAQRSLIFSQAEAVVLSSGVGRDWRLLGDTRGTIAANNLVMVKPDASSPEMPYSGARVRLHNLIDGRLAWEGISDALGYYWPRGLEVGAWYYPVAIDLTGTHECDAAGPVQAVRAT